MDGSGTDRGNLTAPSQVRALLARHGIRPKRRLGQHFLIDGNILRKIVEAADLTPSSNVLEIGPGLGTLTRELAGRAAKVVAVEADGSLMPVLEETLAAHDGLVLVHGDALKVDLERLCPPEPERGWKVVANLPYYITAPMMIRLLELGTDHGRPPGRFGHLVVMVQHEVARRMAARPGSADYGAFALRIQYHARVETVATVGPRCFYPPPKVGSAVVSLSIHASAPVEADPEPLFALIRAAFSQRRKSILNALKGGFKPPAGGPVPDRAALEGMLNKAGIDPLSRGEVISLEGFARLARTFDEYWQSQTGQTDVKLGIDREDSVK